MNSKHTFFLYNIMVLLTYEATVRGSCVLAPLRFNVSRDQFIDLESIDGGLCTQHSVHSQAQCYTLCYTQSSCRLYVVTGPCDPTTPDVCHCLNCQKDIVITQGASGNSTVATLVSTRLVDGDNWSWDIVAPECLHTISNISPTLNYDPLPALELTGVIMTGSTTRFTAVPKCPARNKRQGEVYCEDIDGIWHGQDSLACFPLDCYQMRGGTLYYAGTQSVTRYGRTCQSWTASGPVVNNMLWAEYPFDDFDIRKAKNFCRAFPPGTYLWCYNGGYNGYTDLMLTDRCAVPEC